MVSKYYACDACFARVRVALDWALDGDGDPREHGAVFWQNVACAMAWDEGARQRRAERAFNLGYGLARDGNPTDWMPAIPLTVTDVDHDAWIVTFTQNEAVQTFTDVTALPAVRPPRNPFPSNRRLDGRRTNR